MCIRDSKPANTIPNETRNLVVDLYRNKYYDANFEHFTELLGKHEDIYLSPSAVMSILEAEYILSLIHISLCCISIVGISCHNIAFFTIAQQKKPVKHFSVVFSFVFLFVIAE